MGSPIYVECIVYKENMSSLMLFEIGEASFFFVCDFPVFYICLHMISALFSLLYIS